MKDYRTYSYWLETAGDNLEPRPPLEHSIDVDVAIVGAGYSGLWTAYYLLQREPGLRVAILEREIAGFGASGRNGGWCSATFPVSLEAMHGRFGAVVTRDLQRAMSETVDEVGRVCVVEGIDADFTKGGCLRIARGQHQLPALLRLRGSFDALGLQDSYRYLDRVETSRRVRVAGAEASLFTPDCASIHPGKLVRGLARVVERLGVRLYERTAVLEINDGPRLRTAGAGVRAGTVVLAGEAYLNDLKCTRRHLVPVYSLIALTDPLPDDLWTEIGWNGRECISSMRYTVDYLNRTVDGRILFGSRGAPYHFGSRIDDRFDRHSTTHEAIKRLAMEWFPLLREVRFSHNWGGPVGMPRDWMPSVDCDRGRGVAWAGGYTGQGVATSNLAGRILADLIGGHESAITRLPFVGHRNRRWEPEPLRWLAVRYMQHAYGRIDRKAERTGKAPTGKSMAERLGRH